MLEPLLDPISEPPTEEDLSRLQESFASRLSYIDEQLSVLLTRLEELRLREECWVILTSDCGQRFGEFGLFGRIASPLHSEQVQIPLIVCPPGLIEGYRCGAITQSDDLLPTILDLFQIENSLAGTSLIPLLEGEMDQIHEHVLARHQDSELESRSVRSLEWMYLQQDGPEIERSERLFQKPEDRWEVNDVMQLHFEIVEELASVVAQK